jgi:hypothetical protein
MLDGNTKMVLTVKMVEELVAPVTHNLAKEREILLVGIDPLFSLFEGSTSGVSVKLEFTELQIPYRNQ